MSKRKKKKPTALMAQILRHVEKGWEIRVHRDSTCVLVAPDGSTIHTLKESVVRGMIARGLVAF